MDTLFQQALSVMEDAFRALEGQMPPPRLVPFKDGFVYRYSEQSAHEALVQKLARIVSGLHAARILLEKGFVQEQGVIQRTLDEFNEDILFLCHGLGSNKLNALHQEYLSSFYEEEFDNPHDPLASTQKRAMVPRKKIRAYLARLEGIKLDPTRGVEVSRTISKAYSGFVHGASPHIMDMYGGSPPKFHIAGMIGTPRIEEHREDLWNYFYRSILSFIAVAKVFGDKRLFESLQKYRDHFEAESGTSYGAWARGET